MISNFFSWHTYFLMNIAIILSFLLTRILFAILHTNLLFSQIQQLRFARFCLIASLIIFAAAPVIISYHPIDTSGWEWKPVLKQAYQAVNAPQNIMSYSEQTISDTSTPLSLATLIITAWCIGFGVMVIRQIKRLFLVESIRYSAFCQHKIKNTHVMFSNDIHSPCCWSLLHLNFIALPYSLLENSGDVRLTLRHELQHIRQGDTQWLQVMQILNLLFYCNPFMKSWTKLFRDKQEYACDEEIILNKKTSPTAYGECLLKAAAASIQSTDLSPNLIAINGFSSSLLYRRVNMLFAYKTKNRKLSLLAVYLTSISIISSGAFAVGNSPSAPLTTNEVKAIIQKENLSGAMHIKANSAVITELNRIRGDNKARDSIENGLQRMKEHTAYLKQEFRKNNIPNDMLALPLVESRYQQLPESVNPVQAAGIWQFIPSTAAKFGLTVNDKQDDRMNMQLSTQAAIKYLNALYDQFHDWKLAVMSYEIGENATEELIKLTGSRDAWTIAQSPKLPEKYKPLLKKYLAMFDSAVIVIHQPDIISD